MDDPITHYCFRCEKYVAEGSHTCRPAPATPSSPETREKKWTCTECGTTAVRDQRGWYQCPKCDTETPTDAQAFLTVEEEDALAADYDYENDIVRLPPRQSPELNALLDKIPWGDTGQLNVVAELLALYNRQREEVKYLNAANDALSSRLERLKAEQITDSDLNTLEAAFALLENGEDGRDHDDELDAFDRLLTKLRESEDKP